VITRNDESVPVQIVATTRATPPIGHSRDGEALFLCLGKFTPCTMGLVWPYRGKIGKGHAECVGRPAV
jgi:hypothetical protein